MIGLMFSVTGDFQNVNVQKEVTLVFEIFRLFSRIKDPWNFWPLYLIHFSGPQTRYLPIKWCWDQCDQTVDLLDFGQLFEVFDSN